SSISDHLVVCKGGVHSISDCFDVKVIPHSDNQILLTQKKPGSVSAVFPDSQGCLIPLASAHSLQPELNVVMTYRSLILVLVGWLSLMLSPAALSQEEVLPTEASVQQALDSLKDSKLSPADIKAREEVYQSKIGRAHV